jgi:hypothetical protein
MSRSEPPTGAWRSLDGERVGEESADPNLILAHVSDLHGQLTPRYQVYYDNPTSSPPFDFGDDDRVIERGGGFPLLSSPRSWTTCVTRTTSVR